MNNKGELIAVAVAVIITLLVPIRVTVIVLVVALRLPLLDGTTTPRWPSVQPSCPLLVPKSHLQRPERPRPMPKHLRSPVVNLGEDIETSRINVEEIRTVTSSLTYVSLTTNTLQVYGPTFGGAWNCSLYIR